MILIRHRHHRLQATQIAIRAPVFRQFNAGAFELVRVALKLGFQAFQQGEGIRRRPREAADHQPTANAPHFAGGAFDDGLAECHLPIPRHGDRLAATDRENGRPVPAHGVMSAGGVLVLHGGQMG